MDWREVPAEVIATMRTHLVINGVPGVQCSDKDVAQEIIKMNSSGSGVVIDWGQER